MLFIYNRRIIKFLGSQVTLPEDGIVIQNPTKYLQEIMKVKNEEWMKILREEEGEKVHVKE